MQFTDVKWKQSQTKKIYQAAFGSEKLMEYLESQLLTNELITEIIDDPNPKRGYGNMIYKYNQRNRLLTSAPRKRENYIHVVLSFGKLDHLTLTNNNLKVGNARGKYQDVKLYSESEIDVLIKLIADKFSHK